MTYSLRVSRAGSLIFEAPVSELYAKMIALLGWSIPILGGFTVADAAVLVGRVVLTIEDSLQDNPACHAAWKDICETPGAVPVDVEVAGLGGTPGKDAVASERGGAGGTGAWPGGGGGGGGASGGWGGNGAGGAIAIFEYSKDRRLLDVEVFVTPETSSWVCPMGVGLVDVIAIGGGGGGGTDTVAVTSIHPGILSR